jgi:hypothetical protein
MVEAAPERTSNARISGIIAVVTIAAVGTIVFVVPPLATRLTTTTKASTARPNGIFVSGPSAGPDRAPLAVAVTVVGPAPSTPSLPPPGVEQPPEPEAARVQVREALTTLFSGTNDRQTRLTAVDDRTNVDAAMDQVRKQYPEASDSSEPEMADLVFTDAANASFLFRLRYVGAPLLPSRMGTARLVDGRWLITRSTLCDVLSSAGATCG